MKRREFFSTAAAAGTLPLAGLASAAEQNDGRQFIELVKIHTNVGAGRGRLLDFYRDVAVPAYNRLGIKSVGVFTVQFGNTDPTLYVLLPHESLVSLVTLRRRFLDDEEVKSRGRGIIDAPLDRPAYVRMESSLMLTFAKMAKVEVPSALLDNPSRLYELRIYQSHSNAAAVKKIEMFNEGGEIQIFRDTGLQPVFFGETLVGPDMPNLTYMLVFDGMESRYASWDRFRTDPAWLKLREDPQYADTVSNVTDIILRPASFSQI